MSGGGARQGTSPFVFLAALAFAAFFIGYLSSGGGADSSAAAAAAAGGATTVRGAGGHSDAGGEGPLTLGDSFFIPVSSRAPAPDKAYPSRTPTRTPSPASGVGGKSGSSVSAASRAPAPAKAKVTASASPSPSHSPAPPRHLQRIAIGIRASVVWMERWRKLLNAMARRKDIGLFFSLWKEQPDEAQVAAWRAEPDSPLLTVKYEPGGTWTSGRNLVAKSIYEEEVRRGKRFDYWTFADADAAFVECYRCPATQLPDVTGAACCLDFFFDVVLNKAYNFSAVSTILAREEYGPFLPIAESEVVDRTFMFRDCADGQFQAYHRDIVPVILPYHEELDYISWWSSQGILFQFTSTCTPGSGVLPGRNFRPNYQEHVDYNRGERDQGKEQQLVRDAFPELALSPTNPQNPNFMCLSNQRGVATLDPSSGRADVVDWRSLDTYKKCVRVKEPHFVATVGNGVPQPPN